MKVHHCKQCNNPILKGAKKYCSNACRQKSYRSRQKVKKGTNIKRTLDCRCRYCGKVFQTDNPRREYCSANHKKQNYREQRAIREAVEMDQRLRTWTGATVRQPVLEYA